MNFISSCLRLLTLFLTLIIFNSCITYKTIPLKGTYSNGNFEAYSEKSKDDVWDNIIDFFAKSGISIRIIDKSSGLIISGPTELTWTFEDSKGVPVNKNAWVVIQKTIDSYSKKPVKYFSVVGEWNIRIKNSDEKTLINVNLVNPSYFYVAGDKTSTMFKKGTIQSSEVFEKTIYEKVK